MRAKEVTSVQIQYENTWLDYSDGTLTIDIVRGVTNNEGPWSMPDVGQLRLTTRNPELDPYANNYVRFGSPIRIVVSNEPIYTGTISAIDVNYRPKGEPPIISINAIDTIGRLERTILPTGFANQRADYWSTFALFQDLEADVNYNNGQLSNLPGLVVNRVNGGGTYRVQGSIDNNQSWWQVMTDRLVTDLTFAYADRKNELWFYQYPDYESAIHPNVARPIAASFASDGSELGYKNITLEDGFSKIINYAAISYRTVERDINTNEVTTLLSGSTFRANQISIDLFKEARKDINLITGAASYFNSWANEAFAEVSAPQIEVQELIWDGMTDVAAASTIDILDNINIDHEVGNGLTLDRKYGVVGIRHSINESDWRVTYIVKNFNYVETSFPTPEIVVNSTEGDTNFVFEFTPNMPEEEVVQAYWNFGDGDTEFGYDQQKSYAVLGNYNVTVEITNYLGWVKTSDPLPITVYGAAPTTSFTWEVSPTSWNTVNFTWTGEAAATYLWDFGDGSTSTEKNPQHSYYPEGDYTVTLTATNIYGSTQFTDTVTVTDPGPGPGDETGSLPIRYLKLVQPSHYEDLESYTLYDSELWHNFNIFAANTSTGTNLADNKPTISLNVAEGQFSNTVSLGIQPASCYSYNKIHYEDWNIAIEPYRLTFQDYSKPVDPITKYDASQPGTCKYSEWDLTIDLLEPYNTVKEISMGIAGYASTKIYPEISVYGSVDQQTWTLIGKFKNDPNYYSGNRLTMVPEGAMPPNV